ncbi:MAG TPA: amino acid ABC transporter substrate-binding protein [Devosiaceae bacterium]|nr:amino acid ABC transporter substrate-binding protein [Devosiaceae bacterium]
MTSRRFTTLLAATSLAAIALCGTAEAKVKLPAASTDPNLASRPVQNVKVGYLGLVNDPRNAPDLTYTDIQLAPPDDPVTGAQLGIADEAIVANANGFNLSLDVQKAADIADLVAKVKAMAAGGERFIILDLPDDLVDQLAAQTKGIDVTFLNASAHDDYLRDRCYPNLLHTAASNRMLEDALVQYLKTRSWNKVLVLQGPLPADKAIADAFKASANRLRLNVVDTRTFTLSRTPDSQENNNALLVTGGIDYDVIFVADTEGEYGRYLPYSTQLARPVVGTAGLVPAEWHWSWDRDGATQVTSRFLKATDRRREMTGTDWSTWMAAKAISDAYGRSPDISTPDQIDSYLKSQDIEMDGSKGFALNFRPWDGQLRQPIVLATDNAVIAAPPLPGFLHQTNDLDTLGEDEPEHACR